MKRILVAAAAVMALSALPATAQETAKTATENPVVAKVNGSPIKKQEVMDLLSAMPPMIQQMPLEKTFPQAVEQLVNSKILADAAKNAGLGSDPEVKKIMAQVQQQVMQEVYLTQKVKARLTDNALKTAYEDFIKNNPPQEEVKLHHILAESEDAAKDIIKKLDNGEDFDKVAAEAPAGVMPGGDLGYVAKNEMPTELADAAFKLEPGKYSEEPVKSQLGYHVIMVEEKRMRRQPTFDEVKPQLQARMSEEIVQEIMSGLRKKAKVEIFGMDGKPVEKKAGKTAEKKPAAKPVEVKKEETKPEEAAPTPVEPKEEVKEEAKPAAEEAAPAPEEAALAPAEDKAE